MSVCRHITLNVKLFLLSFFTCRVSESTRTWGINAVLLFYMMKSLEAHVPCTQAEPKQSTELLTGAKEEYYKLLPSFSALVFILCCWVLANPEICCGDLLFPSHACSEGAAPWVWRSAAHTVLCTRAALSACVHPLQPGLRAALGEGTSLACSLPQSRV